MRRLNNMEYKICIKCREKKDINNASRLDLKNWIMEIINNNED